LTVVARFEDGNPANGTIAVTDFYRDIPEVDGFGGGDRMTGACLTDARCKILVHGVVHGASRDNNCHNIDPTPTR